MKTVLRMHTMHHSLLRLVVVVAGLYWTLPASGSATEGTSEKTGASIVLDEYSYWRLFPVFRPAVYAEKADGTNVPEGQPRTDPPPADWTGLHLDDSRWFRSTGPILCGDRSGEDKGIPEISRICLRGKFNVPDPAKVESLSLSALYRGGIVVYMNGQEIARGHIAPGDLTEETLGLEYPLAAYDGTEGRQSSEGGSATETLRRRVLSDVPIPRELLRRGVNVVAVELRRSPIHPESQKKAQKQKHSWLPTAGLQEIRLAAKPEGSVDSNTRRPQGIQVWNESIIADVYDLDYGDPNEPLRPIQMVGVRHGAFSGQIAVGSDKPLTGLRAAAGELRTPDGGGTIPAGAIRVFYPQPTGNGSQRGRNYAVATRVRKRRFDALADSPPAEVPLGESKGDLVNAGGAAVPGAVQPVRVTVEVPADTPPGIYEGRLTVVAEGLSATEVPIRMKVIDWTLPEATEFSSHLGIVQSIDTLALQYRVPMWSEQHWKLIDRSFQILGRTGVDVLYLPLVMKHHWGKEALVRWVRNKDGSLSCDYSLLDRYLDTAFRHLKKPEVICLYAWVREYKSVDRSRPSGQPVPNVPVPLLDPDTGQVSELAGPPYNSSEAIGFWKPVLEACRERLKKRGIEDEAIVIGLGGDTPPDEETVDVFCEAAPWARWAGMAHPGFTGVRGSKARFVAGYGAKVWLRGVPDPSEERRFGWQTAPDAPRVWTVFPRIGSPLILREETGMAAHWAMQETYMMVGVRGISRIGAEFWPVVDAGKSKKSTFVSLYDTPVPTMNCAVIDLLAPGPDGALSTARLETLYEGTQEAEARAFIEKALQTQAERITIDGLPAQDTSRKLQAVLDARPRVLNAYRGAMDWYAGSGWEERSEQLYEAASAVAKATAGEPAGGRR